MESLTVYLKGRQVARLTAVYPDVSPQMAMKIDGEYAFKWMTRGKFLRQAEKLGLAPRTMGKEIDRMVKRIAIELDVNR